MHVGYPFHSNFSRPDDQGVSFHQSGDQTMFSFAFKAVPWRRNYLPRDNEHLRRDVGLCGEQHEPVEWWRHRARLR